MAKRKRIKSLKEVNDEHMEAINFELEIREKPNYYAVLPAEIRYSKDLTYLERILYAEITALSNKEGYCFATNAYFASHYNNSERTISRSISKLVDKGFLFILLEVVGDKTLRKIYLRDAAEKQIPIALLPPTTKMSTPIEKEGGGVDKNVYHNSTIGDRSIGVGDRTIGDSINTNPNTSTVSTPPAEASALKLTLPDWLGNNSHVRLGRLYELLWMHHMAHPTKLRLTGQTGALFKRLLADYSEILVGLMLIVHFEWRGLSGNDDRILKTHRDHGYPLSWIPSRAATYLAFIRSTMAVKDDTEGLKYITKALKELSPE